MRKENKPNGKIRVFLFELEGTDETLLESVRSIAGAVNRTFSNTTQVVTKVLAPPTNGEKVEDLSAEAELHESIEEDENTPITSSMPKNKRARRRTTPEIIPDLDLTSGSSSLKSFCEKKNPDNDTLKYLVIAIWLRDNRDLKEVSINHVYTCYRLMGWSNPEDFGRVFQNAKPKGYFTKGSSKGSWAITHIGENRVTEMKEVE